MSSVDRILEQALAGHRISAEDCVTLYESDQIEKMGHVANQIMLRHHPEPITTFVIGRNVNYTNICDVYCRFLRLLSGSGLEGRVCASG